LLFVGLLAATFGFVTATATWRLPDLKRIEMPTGNIGIQLHDLMGISVCVGRSLVPAGVYSGEMTLERLAQIYHPEHVQRAFGPPPLLEEAALERNAEGVEAAAAAARIEHPWCYLRHRARIFLHAVGANSGPVFYLVQADVYPGEAGTEVTPTDLTASAVSYIIENESSIFARGYFYALLALGALLVASRGAYRPRMRKALLPVAGACTYLLGSFFVVPAADARYNFWPNLVFMVTLCCTRPLPKLPLPPSGRASRRS
jgi:hypothetical protein